MQRPLPPAIAGVTVTIDAEAVHVPASTGPCATLELRRGRRRHRARRTDILNVHVHNDYDGDRPADDLAAFAARGGSRGGLHRADDRRGDAIRLRGRPTTATCGWPPWSRWA